ncbi:MAG: biopolymer transporter ExbD, partial [Planctomycetes bacterium]|nr:biopolymer transporter ExbD [Planctomycetota bacterium]
MNLNHKHRDKLPRMNMTPMIDIVFLLIIFFMTISQ